MLKRTFKYTDMDGIEREEDAWFHLTKTETLELTLSYPGGMLAWIRRVSNARDGASIIKYMRDVILKAYGVKSDDGRRFIKSEKISEEFAQTPMFDELFQELAFDEKKMADFVNAILPEQKGDGGAIKDFQPGPLEVVGSPVSPAE